MANKKRYGQTTYNKIGYGKKKNKLIKEVTIAIACVSKKKIVSLNMLTTNS